MELLPTKATFAPDESVEVSELADAARVYLATAALLGGRSA
jgi:hypothetical protein